MNLGVTLGQRWKRRASVPVASALLAPESWKPQGQNAVPSGFQCVTYLSLSLPPAHASITPTPLSHPPQGFGTRPWGVPATAHI